MIWPMRRIVAIVSVVLTTAAAAGAAAGPRFPGLPPGTNWSHAEVNVIVRHQPHTLVYDRGRIQSLSGTTLTLRELDGSLVTVEVSPTAVVTIDGQMGSLSGVRLPAAAVTLRVDGAAAVRVAVKSTPPKPVRAPGRTVKPATTR